MKTKPSRFCSIWLKRTKNWDMSVFSVFRRIDLLSEVDSFWLLLSRIEWYRSSLQQKIRQNWQVCLGCLFFSVTEPRLWPSGPILENKYNYLTSPSMCRWAGKIDEPRFPHISFQRQILKGDNPGDWSGSQGWSYFLKKSLKTPHKNLVKALKNPDKLANTVWIRKKKLCSLAQFLNGVCAEVTLWSYCKKRSLIIIDCLLFVKYFSNWGSTLMDTPLGNLGLVESWEEESRPYTILSILFVTLWAFARNKYKEEAKIGVGPN